MTAVAAIDEDAAQDALQLVEIAYEQLLAIFHTEAVTKEYSPQIHDHAERNIFIDPRWNSGHIEMYKGIAESDNVREETALLPQQ